MKKISVNPILVVIIILLTAIVFFSPKQEAQSNLEQRVAALEQQIAVQNQRIAGLEKYNINSDAEYAEAVAKAEEERKRQEKAKRHNITTEIPRGADRN